MTDAWKHAIEQKMMLAFVGKEAPQRVLSLLAEREIAGFTLFRSFNYQSPAQVRELTTLIQKAVTDSGGRQLFFAADQEGGQLNALGEGTTQFAGNMALGAVDDLGLTKKVGQALGRELRAMGVNVNYAPVCDLNTNPDNPGLGIRSFGDDPNTVAEHCAAIVTGLKLSGVAASLKHFPGAGESSIDSHHQLPVIDHAKERLDAVELPPFKAAIDAGADMIMSGHFAIPVLTGDKSIPATISRAVMHDFARNELAFEGVMITDALDMGPMVQGEGQIVNVIAAVRAGVDLLLLTADWEAQEKLDAGLKQAYTRGLIHDDDLIPSIERINKLKDWMAQFEQPDLDVVGCAEHQALAQELAERSLTLVRNDANLLPLQLPSSARIAIVTPAFQDLTPADTSSYLKPSLANAVRQYHANVDEFVTAHSPSDKEIASLKDQLSKFDIIIAGSISASLNPQQSVLIQTLLELDIPIITVALRTPYDLTAYQQTQTHICTYSIHPQSMDALAAALWGQIPFQGKLPTVIPGLYDRGYGITLGKEIESNG